MVWDEGKRTEGTNARNPGEGEGPDEGVTYARSLVTLDLVADCRLCVRLLLRSVGVTQQLSIAKVTVHGTINIPVNMSSSMHAKDKLTKRTTFVSLLCYSLVLAACHLAVADDEKPSPRHTRKSAEGVRFDPVVKQIEGWTVHVDPQLLEGEHRETGTRALQMLANHLQRIAILVPEDRLAKMRKLEIWIEHHHPTLGAMQYHPNLGWLRSRGHDPRLAKKMHITRAASLFSRHQMIKHPAVILHELAHAYHDQYLGFDDPRIIKAYKKAKAAGTYEEVLLYNGRKVRHYALSDHKEYFAEGTEAYFYRNDFYPFVRAELKEHDPTLHDLLAEVWGPLH